MQKAHKGCKEVLVGATKSLDRVLLSRKKLVYDLVALGLLKNVECCSLAQAVQLVDTFLALYIETDVSPEQQTDFTVSAH